MIREALTSAIPVTNIESWIQLGKKKSGELLLIPEKFPFLYPEGKPNNEDDLKRLYFRGLTEYEFNTSIYEALAIVNDRSLTDHVVISESKSVFDINTLPDNINRANFRRFMYELDYILIWKSIRDFHTVRKMKGGFEIEVPVSIEDVRRLDGIREYAIIVFHLSGYTKEVGDAVSFFRVHGAGTPDSLAPLPGYEDIPGAGRHNEDSD